MKVLIEWAGLNDPDPAWDECRCLYAYLHPSSSNPLYIGKAWGRTVRQRWVYSGKRDVWEWMEENGISHHIPVIGRLRLPVGRRLSETLLSDVESLLIHRLQPPANIQSKTSRIARPGMCVHCTGEWPLLRSRFLDK